MITKHCPKSMYFSDTYRYHPVRHLYQYGNVVDRRRNQSLSESMTRDLLVSETLSTLDPEIV